MHWLNMANVKKVFWSASATVMVFFAAALMTNAATANVAVPQTAQAQLNSNCPVIIYEKGTNAPGTDTPAKANYEFLRLVNRSAGTVNVQGWWVQDDYPHVYTLKGVNLPSGSPFRDAGADAVPNNADDQFVMPAGSSVYLYNGAGTDNNPTNNSAAIYRNVGHHFNNGGDTLSLRNGVGKTQNYIQYTSYREKIGPLTCPV